MRPSTKTTPTKPKKKVVTLPRNQMEYQDFIQWVAAPKPLRKPKTQRELASSFGIGEDTLSDWKRRQDFWEKVSEARQKWTREKTSDVLYALYKKAVSSGNATEVRLWMEIVEGIEKSERVIDPQYEEIRKMSDSELKAELRKLEAFFAKK